MVARFRLEPDRAAGVIARAKDVREAALRLAEADAALVDVVAAAYALPDPARPSEGAVRRRSPTPSSPRRVRRPS